MFTDALAQLIATQRNRPLTLAVAILALFLPTSLIIFLSKPELYTTLGLNAVILLSVSASLPIVMLCFSLWYTPFSALRKAQRLLKGHHVEEEDLEKVLEQQDPLEWPCLLLGGWTANFILYSVAAYSYSHPLRIGATFLLMAVILLGLWLALWAMSAIFYKWVQRRWNAQNTPRAA